jgi:hypothetical protein
MLRLSAGDVWGDATLRETRACFDGANEGKTPHYAFSVDETSINRSM